MAAMLVFGTMTAINNMGQYSAMTATNVGLMNLAIPIGCVFMMICQVEYYFNHLHDRDEGEGDTAV